MTAAIYRRVEALEAAGTGEAGIDFIVITFVRPGHLDAKVATADMLGQRFERLPSETEDDFIARLRRYADDHRPPDQRAVQVFCHPADLDL